MPKFSANLTMMFPEHGFLDRIGAAKAAGFSAVEFQFPYEFPPEAIGERLSANKLTQAMFNFPPGDWNAGERGIACLAGREAEFVASIEKVKPYIAATGAKRLLVMAGNARSDDAAALARFKTAIRRAAETFGAHGIDILLEPLNTRDNPGYFLVDFEQAADIIADLGLPNVKLQFDIYHCQILHGDVTMRLRKYLPIIGHVQVASIPSRHEPMSEELADAFLFAELDRLGYAGYVGCEYRPKGETTAGLGWFAPWRRN